MIQTILNYFHTFWEYITNAITGLVGMIAAFVSANQVLSDVIAFAPAVLSAAVGITITAFIIKFILGRWFFDRYFWYYITIVDNVQWFVLSYFVKVWWNCNFLYVSKPACFIAWLLYIHFSSWRSSFRYSWNSFFCAVSKWFIVRSFLCIMIFHS